MSDRPRRTLPSSLEPSGKVAKKSTTYVKKTKEQLREAMSSIPSEYNTLIVDGGVHKTFLKDIKPKDLVFVFYDTPKVWPTPDYSPTIEGCSLEEVNAGICDTKEREHDVISKEHKFKNGKKEQVFAVKYNGETFKVKHSSLKPNGHPYFFIEYLKDQFNPDPEISGSGIRYYGEFMSRSVPEGTTEFGKKRKSKSKGSLCKDLKYLLTL
jgi:hypothetical protein